MNGEIKSTSTKIMSGCLLPILGIIFIFTSLFLDGDLEDIFMIGGIFSIVIGFIISWIGSKENNTNLEKETKKIIEKYPFNESYTYIKSYSNKITDKVSDHLSSGVFYKLSIDTDNEKILILHIYSDNYGQLHDEAIIRDFEDLIEVKVKMNSETITSASGNIGGALLGGLIGGGVGAMIGGTSSSTSETGIHRLSLEFVFNDVKNPVTEVVFYEDKIHPISYTSTTTGEKYRELTTIVNEWLRRLEVIMYQTKSDKQNNQ